jgi:hypothetical protein
LSNENVRRDREASVDQRAQLNWNEKNGEIRQSRTTPRVFSTEDKSCSEARPEHVDFIFWEYSDVTRAYGSSSVDLNSDLARPPESHAWDLPI